MYGSTSSSAPISSKTRKLTNDSLTVLNESTQIGDSVMGQLKSQGKSLAATQGRLEEMHGMTDESRKALDAMDRKACVELTFLYLTIFALVVLIVLVSYRELTNKGRLF